MAELRLNKTELKNQKTLLDQLSKYLPTLQLKKQQLQVEVNNMRSNVELLRDQIENIISVLKEYSFLFSEFLPQELLSLVEVANVISGRENIAGVEVPQFEDIVFKEVKWSYFTTPVWIDRAVIDLKSLVTLRERYKIAADRLALLEEELRQTNIKVNLFEKRMIPQCRENIKKIRIFLGDQEIAAICNAKIAKDKLKKKDAVKEEATA